MNEFDIAHAEARKIQEECADLYFNRIHYDHSRRNYIRYNEKHLFLTTHQPWNFRGCRSWNFRDR